MDFFFPGEGSVAYRKYITCHQLSRYITAVQSTTIPNWIWRSVLFNDFVCYWHYVSSMVDEGNMFVDDWQYNTNRGKPQY